MAEVIELTDGQCIVHWSTEIGTGLDGQSFSDISHVISLRPELRGRELVETIIHERLHHVFPSIRESVITSAAHDISHLIYSREILERAGL